MNQPTADTPETAETQTSKRRFDVSTPFRPSIQTALGGIALAPVAATTVLRVIRNGPVTMPEWLGAVFPVVSTLAAVTPALALAGLGAAVDRRSERVALLAAAVFPLLAVYGDPAWLPAAAALVVGGGTTVALALQRRGFHPGPTAVAAPGVGALWCSLVAAAGIATVSLQSFGAVLAFGALAVLPVARSLDTAGLLAWVAGTLAVVWLVASVPFVAGAVTLVAFAAGDVPVVLLAGGVAGALVVAFASGWDGDWGVAVGTLLVLAAGAPASLARGTAAVLGLVVLVARWDGPASDTGGRDGPTDVTGGDAGA